MALLRQKVLIKLSRKAGSWQIEAFSGEGCVNLHPRALFTQKSCQSFGIFIIFFTLVFFPSFQLWELLNADIYTIHMFALKLPSVM